MHFFFVSLLRPTPRSTLFPYTTLFRSRLLLRARDVHAAVPVERRRRRQLGPAGRPRRNPAEDRSEEHTSELQSRGHLVCRLLLEKKKQPTSVEQGNFDISVEATASQCQ